MKFPTGGKVREPKGMIRCNSGTDSKVWMKEEIYFEPFRLGIHFQFYPSCLPVELSTGIFLFQEESKLWKP